MPNGRPDTPRCYVCNAYLRGAYKRLASEDARYERYEARCRQGHLVRITVRRMSGEDEKAERRRQA